VRIAFTGKQKFVIPVVSQTQLTLRRHKMGIINECPYCGKLRDEAVKCCYNWGVVLKIDKIWGIKNEPTIPEF